MFEEINWKKEIVNELKNKSNSISAFMTKKRRKFLNNMDSFRINRRIYAMIGK